VRPHYTQDVNANVFAGLPDVLFERRQGVPASFDYGVRVDWSTGFVWLRSLCSNQVQDRCDSLFHGRTLILVPLDLFPELGEFGLVAYPNSCKFNSHAEHDKLDKTEDN
jgi:hypothetical protein